MIIAIKPSPAFCEALAIPGGLKPDTMHITLFYYRDEQCTPQFINKILGAIHEFCATHKPFLTMSATKYGRFENVMVATDPDGKMFRTDAPTDVIYADIESPALYTLRRKLAELLDKDDELSEYSKLHPEFKAHISVKYVPEGEEPDNLAKLPLPFAVGGVQLWFKKPDGNESKYAIMFGS